MCLHVALLVRLPVNVGNRHTILPACANQLIRARLESATHTSWHFRGSPKSARKSAQMWHVTQISFYTAKKNHCAEIETIYKHKYEKKWRGWKRREIKMERFL